MVARHVFPGIFFPVANWRPENAQKSSGSATSDISPAFFLEEKRRQYTLVQ
jgi:hypothetical protein